MTQPPSAAGPLCIMSLPAVQARVFHNHAPY